MTADVIAQDKGPKSFDEAQAKSAINALLKFVNKKKKDALFLDAGTRLLMDVTVFKVPSGSNHYYNIVLPHSPHPSPLESLDILLVVRDRKGLEPERIIGEVKDELRNSETRDKLKVRQIMTLKQLKDDYSTFEAKRALSKSVDVVIVEQNIFKVMPRILGREFQKKKKFHLSIPGRQFKDKDLGEQILYALQKTVMNISLNGQTSTIVVGQDNLTADELVTNVSKIAYWLKRKFPGGWKNIQKLSLHTAENGMPPLVIYFSTGSANDVKKPPVTRGGSIPDPTEGDMSTQPGSRIRVHPTGEIEVFEEKVQDEDRELIEAVRDRPPKDLKRKKTKSKGNMNQKRLKQEKVKDEVKDELKEDEYFSEEVDDLEDVGSGSDQSNEEEEEEEDE